MIKLLLLLTCAVFVSATNFITTPIQLGVNYDEKSNGDQMNIYSIKLQSQMKLTTDIHVDAKLKKNMGIYDMPIIFISTVRNC